MNTPKEVAMRRALDLFSPEPGREWRLLDFSFRPETQLPGFSETLPACWVAQFNTKVVDARGLECSPDFSMIVVDDATGEASFFDAI
jgi:hypothetical protein